MHPGLCVDEIVSRIVEEIPDARSLVNLALSCKTLYEPSMNKRWRELSGLIPLLKCMPSDAVEVVDATLGIPFACVGLLHGFAFSLLD